MSTILKTFGGMLNGCKSYLCGMRNDWNLEAHVEDLEVLPVVIVWLWYMIEQLVMNLELHKLGVEWSV